MDTSRSSMTMEDLHDGHDDDDLENSNDPEHVVDKTQNKQSQSQHDDGQDIGREEFHDSFSKNTRIMMDPGGGRKGGGKKKRRSSSIYVDELAESQRKILALQLNLNQYRDFYNHEKQNRRQLQTRIRDLEEDMIDMKEENKTLTDRHNSHMEEFRYIQNEFMCVQKHLRRMQKEMFLFQERHLTEDAIGASSGGFFGFGKNQQFEDDCFMLRERHDFTSAVLENTISALQDLLEEYVPPPVEYVPIADEVGLSIAQDVIEEGDEDEDETEEEEDEDDEEEAKDDNKENERVGSQLEKSQDSSHLMLAESNEPPHVESVSWLERLTGTGTGTKKHVTNPHNETYRDNDDVGLFHDSISTVSMGTSSHHHSSSPIYFRQNSMMSLSTVTNSARSLFRQNSATSFSSSSSLSVGNNTGTYSKQQQQQQKRQSEIERTATTLARELFFMNQLHFAKFVTEQRKVRDWKKRQRFADYDTLRPSFSLGENRHITSIDRETNTVSSLSTRKFELN